jgi:hypothetical protein
MRILGPGVVILGVLLLGAAGSVSGEGDPEAGASSYRVYCGACHGAVGPGGREVPGEAPDLTRLEERYGAPLANTRLLEHIGRRDPAAASFERDMSVCGTLLLRDLDPTAGLRAGRRGTALAILQYLERVQRAPESPAVAIRGRTR